MKGVVVSDGCEVVVTNARGRYAMRSGKKNGYVFISIPSGYDVGRDGLIPRHFVRLSGQGDEVADFELTPCDNKKHTLLVFTDVHLTGDAVDKDLPQFRATFLPDICRQIRSTEGPVYGLCLGDMTTDAKWYKNQFALPEYLEAMKDLRIPVFHTVGNHDNDRKIEGNTDYWKYHAKDRYRNEIGPNYYSFNLGDVHYVVLDNIITYGPQPKDDTADYDYHPGVAFNYRVDSIQLAWMKKDLSFVPKDKPLVIAMHVPLYVLRQGEEGNIVKPGTSHMNAGEVTDLVKGFNEVHFLYGHRHLNENILLNEHLYSHNICSVSAVSWKLNDVPYPLTCSDGSPAGYEIFSMDGPSVRWVFKAHGLPVEKSQCRLYDLNVEPEEYGGKPRSNEILLDVFNWDPKWKVRILENGVDLPIEQVWSDEPLYTRIRTETKMLPTRPTSFLPNKSWHMFKAIRQNPSSEIKALVTDRFGNEYSTEF